MSDVLYKMTKTAVTTYYLDDVISLNDLRPIIVHALKNWTGKKIGSRIAAMILEEIIDGCYTHIKEEDANEIINENTDEIPDGTETEVDRLVRSRD